LLGSSVDSLTLECSIDSKRFVRALEVAMTEVHKRHLQGWLVALLPKNKAFAQACGLIHEVINQRIDEAFEYIKSSKTTPEDQRHNQLVLVRELAKQTADKNLIRGSVLTTYAAGAESQAVVISNVFFVLSRHPEVFDKLREEVKSIGHEKPKLQVLKNMSYLKGVINEALRLYPLAPFIYRTALHDTTLPLGGGSDGKSPIFVEKHTTYIISILALHRDPSLWGADVEEFKPERWQSPEPGLSGRYQPFGGGRRTCPGQALAMAEMSYIIVRLLQEFKKIESRDARPWLENLKMTFSNRNGVQVALTRE